MAATERSSAALASWNDSLEVADAEGWTVVSIKQDWAAVFTDG